MIRTARFLQASAIALVVVLLVGAVERLGCGPVPPAREHVRGEVSFVYDGDTVEVSGAGRVRLLGVDALDSYNRSKIRSQVRHLEMDRKQVIHWAREAEEFLRRELLDREVQLAFGPERRGDHGRLLAYVYVKKNGERRNVNRVLLQKGYATAYRAFDHPLKGDFIETEREARRQNRGFWQDARSTW